MKDWWPWANRFSKKQQGQKRSTTQILIFRSQNQGLRTQNPERTRHNPLLKEAGLTKPSAAHVVDERNVFISSANFTEAALKKDFEIGL